MHIHTYIHTSALRRTHSAKFDLIVVICSKAMVKREVVDKLEAAVA